MKKLLHRPPWRVCSSSLQLLLILAPILISFLTTPVVVEAQIPCIYAPESNALNDMVPDGRANVEKDENNTHWVFFPRRRPSRIGLIFYGNAGVDERAYSPMLKRLAGRGYTGFLIDLPYLSLSFLSPIEYALNIRDDERYEFIDWWIIGGHGWGGDTAAKYAPHFNGLLLLASAANPWFGSNLSHRKNLYTLSMWGSEDGILSREDWENSRNKLPPDARLEEIECGNHSYMGYYGLQSGDNDGCINVNQQQERLVVLIEDWYEDMHCCSA